MDLGNLRWALWMGVRFVGEALEEYLRLEDDPVLRERAIHASQEVAT